jgi:hypothetical protein
LLGRAAARAAARAAGVTRSSAAAVRAVGGVSPAAAKSDSVEVVAALLALAGACVGDAALADEHPHDLSLRVLSVVAP